MFGVGSLEIVLILAIALIVLGPDRLPQAMGTVGRWIRELRRLTGEFRKEFDEEIQFLQNEVENLRQEAELTRQDLLEIQADLEETIGGVQADLEEAGEDIKSELGMAENAAQGVRLGSNQKPSPKTPVLGTITSPGMEASDAMYRAILETFADSNGQTSKSPLPVVPESTAPSTTEIQSSTLNETIDIAAHLDATETDLEALAKASSIQQVQKFAPQAEQFGVILRVLAQSHNKPIEEAKKQLQHQAAIDAVKLVHLNGRGPTGIALAWAAQRQSAVTDGSIDIDTREEGCVRIRMSECPYGLSEESELPICELSNSYDLTLIEKMGAMGEYEKRVTMGHQQCEFVIRSEELEPVQSVADTGANSDILAKIDETAHVVKTEDA